MKLPVPGLVIPFDAEVVEAIERGLKCPRCHQPFQVWLWPRAEMLVECGLGWTFD